MKKNKIKIKALISFSAALCILGFPTMGALAKGRTEKQPPKKHEIIIEPFDEFINKPHLVVDAGRMGSGLQINEPEEFMGELEIAAYCGCDTCRKDMEGHMPSPVDCPLQGRTIAARAGLFSIGNEIRINGQSYYVEDRLTGRAGEPLRFYFDKHEDAVRFGTQVFPVYRIKGNANESKRFLGTFDVTGYCKCVLCCGNKAENLTKSGAVPQSAHTISADLSLWPLGTKLLIDGVSYTVEDTGKAIKGNELDIYFDTHEEAVEFGRQKKDVYQLDE